MIFNLQRYSLHDGPGIRTTVFLKGCPLRCRWCHNPESQDPRRELLLYPERCIGCGACLAHCPHGAVREVEKRLLTDRSRCRACGSCVPSCAAGARALTGREVTPDTVLAEIEKDLVFYDTSGGGVTFSGGEPLAQPHFLEEMLTRCRERGIHTAVDTCGFASRETIGAVARYTDLFLYDLKLMDEGRHREHTGVSNRPVLENLAFLADHHLRVIVRFPLVAGVNDDEANVHATGRFVASLPEIRRVSILPYHHTARAKYERLGRPYRPGTDGPPSDAVVMRTRAILEEYGLGVTIGG